MSGFYDIAVKKIDGSADLLGGLRGKVTLAVNVASRCGLTPQYEGLEELQRELADQNFTVVGFPCNQFAGQEPGSAEEIVSFCRTTYGVSFPLSEKLDVNGPARSPVYDVPDLRPPASPATSPGTSRSSSSAATAACCTATRREPRRRTAASCRTSPRRCERPRLHAPCLSSNSPCWGRGRWAPSSAATSRAPATRWPCSRAARARRS